MFRIFGPPGTGKTTTLLNYVDQALEAGMSSQDIAFLRSPGKRRARRGNAPPVVFNLMKRLTCRILERCIALLTARLVYAITI